MYTPGTFNWYLFQSGKFVTLMAKAIQAADDENKEKIRKVFPQMVAANECHSWDIVPEGFSEPKYNAEEA